MAITKLNPNTILLAGTPRIVDEYPASAAITPGELVELHNSGGELKWRPHASADEAITLAVALERSELNDTIATAYASGDAVKVAFLQPGDVFYGLLPSGQDINRAGLMQSNGDGQLKTASATTASGGVARFQALDNIGPITEQTRVRTQVIS